MLEIDFPAATLMLTVFKFRSKKKKEENVKKQSFCSKSLFGDK